MVNLVLLRSALQNASLEADFEEVSPTLFDEVVTCIEQEKIDEAARLIEGIFLKDIPDFRLIVYYFYAQFFEQGILSFKEVLPSIISIINESWEILRPITRKEKQVLNSLNWFVLQLISKLKYCEKLHKAGKSHPIWERSLEITPKELAEVIEAADNFKNFFYAKWPNSPIKERVMHLLKVVEDLKSYMITASDEIEENSIVVTETMAEPMEIEPEKPPVAISRQDDPFEKMHAISSKLQLFEFLIKKNEYAKAALVAKDIDDLIENFDPTHYFPKLFANYFALTAKHIGELSKEWENRESLQSKYLEKLYKADPEVFVEW